jgi:hypothetical protein
VDSLSAAADPQGRSPDALRAEVDALLARIEDERLVSGWVWPRLTETVAGFASYGDTLLWMQVAYLRWVCQRGDAMFAAEHTNVPLGTVDVWPAVACRCGRSVPGVRPTRLPSGREVVCVRCPDCGLDLAVYDNEPYPAPTVHVRGLG